MLKYIIKRILWIIPILIGVTIVVFTILYFSPGDPAYLALGDNATPEAVEAYRIEMGINGTYWERLGRTLLGLFQGDLGISYRSRTPVLNELLVRFSVTFNISAWSIVLGIILGIFFGIVAALKQNTILDSLCTGCALFGIDAFWLDNSEPDFGVYDFDHYRYIDGPALSCSNIYPQLYSRVFYDGMKAEGEENIVNLLRCAWAGSQKYGNVVWSGDVPSTFEAFYDQLQAGLNMGLAGIPWWTTDIGGFMTDDVNDPDFQQLLIRWYEFAVYSAVFRMHGDRGPHNIPPLDDRDFGGGYLYTGQSNELWSYGEENYRIMKKYYDIRISMHDYIKQLYDEASENGSPLIRTMFYEFPDDKKCWELQDQYMFGSEYLVAPIFHLNEFEREVYLPAELQ